MGRTREGTLFCKGLLVSNRWMTLVASFFIMSCAGALYSFALYSQKMKTALDYDQETVSKIGFFKDLGANIGVVAGILYDVCGSWLVMLLAGIFNVFGYMMAWAAVTGRIHHVQVWHMCVFLWVGASSGAFASTAVIVTCVKNFPTNRGIVIGLLKGFVGLSGAMLTQIYRALYGEDPSSFMLVVAWFPSFVFIFFMFFVRPMPRDEHDEREALYETRNFYVFLGMAIGLAVFLMVIIVVQHLVKVPRKVNQGLFVVMLIILALPVYVAVESELLKRRSTVKDLEENADIQQEGLKENAHIQHEGLKENADIQQEGLKENAEQENVHTSRFRLRDMSVKKVVKQVCKEIKHMPERGEDHTIIQALVSLDLWIVFIATTAGLGSGLMAIDNLGQMGASMGYSQTNVSTFVSLLSIWNFYGRVGFGFISEILLQKRGVPRPVFLAFVLALMAFGHLYVALAWPGALYIGSVLIGMCFGGQMPLMFAIISEIFGLKYFGTLYNVGILASPLGTYLLSVKTAGHLYDVEARKQTRNDVQKHRDLVCHGLQCFRKSLFIMVGVCVFGSIISLFLAYRTRLYYKSVQTKHKHTEIDGTS